MDKAVKFVTVPLVGAAAFWLPDTVVHLVRSTRFDTPDVLLVTALMPVSLSLFWLVVSRALKTPMSSVAIPFMCGIWFTGGLFMSLGWIWSVSNPVSSVSFSTVVGIVPIYTFMAATYDGSLFALLGVSVVLVGGWLLPMAVGKVQTS
jgi:hypothetical protein